MRKIKFYFLYITRRDVAKVAIQTKQFEKFLWGGGWVGGWVGGWATLHWNCT